jgi:hypothetical protein
MTLVWGGILQVVAPVVAVLATLSPKGFAIELPGVPGGLDLPLVIYMLALVLIGLAIRASALGVHSFLIRAAPSHRRASYIAFLNTLTSPLTMLPLAAAVLADVLGMEIVVFGSVLVGGLLAAGSAWRLRPVEEAAEAHPGADRAAV